MQREKGLSVTKAIFPMVASIMGAGVITLPHSVDRSGLLLSGPLLFFIASMSMFTLFQLVHCAKQIDDKNPSYFLVCQNVSPFLGYVAEACIAMQGFGCCLCYFLILKSWVLKFFLLDKVIEEKLVLNLLISAALLALPLFLALQKDLSKLSFTSMLGTGSVIYLSILVFSCGVLSCLLPNIPSSTSNFKEMQDLTKLKMYETKLGVLFNALSYYIFAIGCQQNMIKVFSIMERQTIANGVKVGTIATLIASSVFFLVANGGYIAGGIAQKGSILDVLESEDRVFFHQIKQTIGDKFFFLITLAKIGMAIVLMSGYPLQMHPTRDSVLIFMNLGIKDIVQRNRRAVEIFSILVMSSIIYVLSITGVSYERVMNIVASTASCYIIYVLPSIAYLASKKKRRCFSFVSMGIMGTGSLISLISLYNIIKAKN